MFQFTLESKKFGVKTVSIDDGDVDLLFHENDKREFVAKRPWYLGYNTRTQDYYAFTYLADGSKVTLSAYLTDGARVFFADDNRLNCCRSNFITRAEKGVRYPSAAKQQRQRQAEETQRAIDEAWLQTRKQLYGR